ncbi:metallophosphoesterase [Bacillus solitudinis]|uniref:metallophosphoesterase n=1 Tax=Bacillus solitudinis TaxID=2014074 RepID=UPI001D0D1EEF|nr:metallophosphoesterase [Bacillus solitudinis]
MKLLLLGLSGLSILLIIYMWIEAHRNRVREHSISLESLPPSFEGFRIFFISDIHRRVISPQLLGKVKCDLVVIGGDLLERGVRIEQVEENLKNLRLIAPTYFIWGNNDREISSSKLKVCLEKNGITELKNNLIVQERSSQTLSFVGVDEEGYRNQHLPLLEATKQYDCSILLCHFPEIVTSLPLEHPFSLCLSGHTHGGQIRLFGWGLAERGGLKFKKGMMHLISNGYGTTGVPLRLCAPAETHVITLRRT